MFNPRSWHLYFAPFLMAPEAEASQRSIPKFPYSSHEIDASRQQCPSTLELMVHQNLRSAAGRRTRNVQLPTSGTLRGAFRAFVWQPRARGDKHPLFVRWCH